MHQVLLQMVLNPLKNEAPIHLFDVKYFFNFHCFLFAKISGKKFLLKVKHFPSTYI